MLRKATYRPGQTIPYGNPLAGGGGPGTTETISNVRVDDAGNIRVTDTADTRITLEPA